MIDIKGLNKSYGSLHVLKNIDLKINRSEIVVIVGASGAGKTTLLQIMGTLDKPDSGTVEYTDNLTQTIVEVTNLKDKQKSIFRNKNIGFIFQFHQLLPEFTALENVMMPALIGGEKKNSCRQRALQLLASLGMSERINHRPSEMSGGEKQRVAVARALINNPQVVFADEPSGSLDSHNREDLKQLFSELHKQYNQTFVIVTHDNSFASIADRIVTMSDGKITNIETICREKEL